MGRDVIPDTSKDDLHHAGDRRSTGEQAVTAVAAAAALTMPPVPRRTTQLRAAARRPRGRIHRLLAHPALNITVGVAVVICSMAELFDQVETAGNLKAAHGMILLGLMHALRSVGDLAEGAHKVAEPVEEL